MRISNGRSTPGRLSIGRFLIDFYTPEEFFSFIGDVYKITPETLKVTTRSICAADARRNIRNEKIY